MGWGVAPAARNTARDLLSGHCSKKLSSASGGMGIQEQPIGISAFEKQNAADIEII